MTKIKYTTKENNKTGTHSWYALPKFTGTLSFEELCEEACDDNTYSVESAKPSAVSAAVWVVTS